MSHPVLYDYDVNFGHLTTLQNFWRADYTDSRNAIARAMGMTPDDIDSLFEDPEAVYTLPFWLLVWNYRIRNKICREGAGCMQSFADLLHLLSEDRGSFPRILSTLDLNEREFCTLLAEHRGLYDEDIAAIEPEISAHKERLTVRNLVDELMLHLVAASGVAVKCNGQTPEVIKLLNEKDPEILDPLRVLLCRGNSPK